VWAVRQRTWHRSSARHPSVAGNHHNGSVQRSRDHRERSTSHHRRGNDPFV